MWYYDVHGGERHNNYITNLKAGETATVHMAWLVPEEELDCLYLNLDTHGGAYEIDPAGIGYVDRIKLNSICGKDHRSRWSLCVQGCNIQ